MQNAKSVSISLDFSIGYLPQQMATSDDTTVVDEVRKVFAHTLNRQQEINELANELASREDYESEDYHKMIEKLSYLEERAEMESPGNYEAEIERTLMGLGFLRSDFDRPTSEFSGGWRMRIELAKNGRTQSKLCVGTER